MFNGVYVRVFDEISKFPSKYYTYEKSYKLKITEKVNIHTLNEY